MLTIFACPKPFRGHINIIQRNAIRSWTLLDPRPEILLIGDEEGNAEVCKDFGLRHIPEVERNEFGTPLVSSIFETAQSEATQSLLCYVNSDIIFMSDFMLALNRVTSELQGRPFLMVGRRWDAEITEHLSFDSDLEGRLRTFVKLNGRIRSPVAIDYFAFSKGLYDQVVRFAIGRPAFDNWLIYYASKRGASIVDATCANMVIHQNHDYSHVARPLSVYSNVEVKRNISMLGGFSHFYTIRDAALVLTDEGLKPAPSSWRYSAIADKYISGSLFMMVRRGYPATLPLILGFKIFRWWYRQTKAKLARVGIAHPT